MNKRVSCVIVVMLDVIVVLLSLGLTAGGAARWSVPAAMQTLLTLAFGYEYHKAWGVVLAGFGDGVPRACARDRPADGG